MENNGPVGVIVARFQVPELHAGHRYTIGYVCERHLDVLIILGVARRMPHEHDMLSFEIRKRMIRNAFPGRSFTIVPNESSPAPYDVRSQDIDDLIRKAFPGRPAVIYGARDSIIHKYAGVFPTQEVPTVFQGSGSEIRKNIEIIDSADFRAGVIYDVMKRPPQVYPAADVAISHGQLVFLVGRNEDQGRLRFPGVFLHPGDESIEAAAQRAVQKEVVGAHVGPFTQLGSMIIDDWRYRQTKDRVLSSFFSTIYLGGATQILPGQGLDKVRAVPETDLMRIIVHEHLPLAELFLRNRP
jgi:bifunctional NMN adenylyltransferase/nudix hydrolase